MATHPYTPLDDVSITTLRMLAIDAVEKAKSGHPGLPMGAAPLAYAMFMRHLRHAPSAPEWVNRDRFVLSPGHGSMLLYALLHLTGYDISLDDLKRFRQLGSITPGHPEYGLTPGVETTTGPLGQGFATGVGMALAERLLAKRYNREGHALIDYRVYGLVSDGDLMEGITAEAASYAGALSLGKLLYVYLNDGITIEGTTRVTFIEDVQKRFEAYGWHVVRLHDSYTLASVDEALDAAKDDARPSLLIADTRIGYGSPHKEGTASVHGAPLGPDEVRLTKEHVGWPLEPTFLIPPEVREHFLSVRALGKEREAEWRNIFEAYREAYPELAYELEERLRGTLPESWQAELPMFSSEQARATREASGEILQVLARHIPLFLGGSADLAPSNNTTLKGFGQVSPAGIDADARNLHFGIREHAMGAITNGLALSRVILPFCATFFIFSDYMRPAMRLAAIMKLRVVYIFTHDSIAQGEDGATHQPIEHLASFRAMPNMVVLRPADANETTEAWRYTLHHTGGPVMLVLTRQKVPTIDRAGYASASGLSRGAYVMNPHIEHPEYLIIATGSEVAPSLEAARVLMDGGVRVRVVSMPSWELFEREEREYRDEVLPPSVTKRMVVEAGSRFGWERHVGVDGEYVTIDTFGASAPGEELMEAHGFTATHIVERVRAHLSRIS